MPIRERPEDERRFIDFLLGQLPGPERESIEKECLSDPGALERLEAIESELIEDYLEGSLDPEERRAFEQEYLNHPERRRKVELVAALNRRFQRSRRFWVPHGFSRFALAGVMLVFLTVSAAYYVLRPGPPYLLEPGGAARSLQESGQVISPGPSTPAVQIRLDLAGADLSMPIDHAILRTVEEEAPVWMERVHPRPGQRSLDLVLQNAILEDRDYILTLEAANAPVASYVFRVHKQP